MPADGYRRQQYNVDCQKLALAQGSSRKEFPEEEVEGSYEEEAEDRVEKDPHCGGVLRAPDSLPLHDEVNVDGHERKAY